MGVVRRAWVDAQFVARDQMDKNLNKCMMEWTSGGCGRVTSGLLVDCWVVDGGIGKWRVSGWTDGGGN